MAVTRAPASSREVLRVIPLGGIGEIGKNMTVFEFADQIIIVDCGLMFPEEEMYGIDLVVPDIAYLRDKRERVKAFVITHAHEDHVGGLPYILPEFPGVPVYASTLARGLLGNKVKEHKLRNNPLLALEPGDTVELGHFDVTAFRIGHSIPDAMGLRIRTPFGDIIHTGDFKFDHTPVDGKPSDFQALARFGEEGVLCLMSDSTRAESPGYTPSERTVGEAFREIMEGLDGPRRRGHLRLQHRAHPAGLRGLGDVRPPGRRHRALHGAEHAHRRGPRLPAAAEHGPRAEGPHPRHTRRAPHHRHDRRPG